MGVKKKLRTIDWQLQQNKIEFAKEFAEKFGRESKVTNEIERTEVDRRKDD